MKLPVWSFTLLNTYANCPRQAHHKYVLKDLAGEEPSPAMTWGIEVHEAMEARIKGKRLPENMTPYEAFVAPLTGARAEMKLGVRHDFTPCGFFDQEVAGRGKLDATVVQPGGENAVIVDWKTGARREDSFELELFSVLLKAHYPKLKKITGWYVWLKDKRIGTIHDLSDTERSRAEIENRVAQLRRSFAVDAWPPRQSGLCPWCPVKKCEFHPERRST